MTEPNDLPPPPTPPESAPPAEYAGSQLPIEHDPQARQWGMFAHLSALAGLIIPAGNFIGPLVVWLMKKDTMPFVNDQGKESLNFQITVLLALLILSPTVCIGVGFVLLPILGVAALIFSVIAGMKANEGVPYRYPWTLRLIK